MKVLKFVPGHLLNLKHENVWEHLQADMPCPLQKEVPMAKVK